MTPRAALWLLLFHLPGLLLAQSTSSLQKQSKQLLSKGEYAKAASLLERAGRLKNSDPDLLFQAGEAYRRVRDYQNAANCYQNASGDSRFPLAGLYYARCLKQEGLLEMAQKALEDFALNYRGKEKTLIINVVENELRGIELAKSLEEKKMEPGDSVAWLGSPVAKARNNFAPIPFGDTILYYSEAVEPQCRLMRCILKNGSWQNPEIARGLPSSAAQNFLSGCFSSDGQRFYFVRTESAPVTSKGSSLEAGKGTLYMLSRDINGSWESELTLPDYINLPGSSNLWPFVCESGDQEYLFFASNRPGGMGGFDLYVCQRSIYSQHMDFSFPQNLGNVVNTGADEANPYFDVFSGRLWFNSMGHPGLGGQDIFYSHGINRDWSKPVNAGKPINSGADDMFFVLKRNGLGGFFVSNRKAGTEKEGNGDDDLFEVFFR